MNNLQNKHGPDPVARSGVLMHARDGTCSIPRDGDIRKPRDGTVIPHVGTGSMPRDGTERMARDGTERMARDGTERMARDGTRGVPADNLPGSNWIHCLYPLKVKPPGKGFYKQATYFRRRNEIGGKPSSGNGGAELCLHVSEE